MKRRRYIGLFLGLLLSVISGRAVATPTARPGNVVTAKAAILIDHQTGEVLWQRNPDLPLPPASTTKIVTALLALQSGRLDDSLSVTAEAAHAKPSTISLRPGWRMRLRDLVYAMLLNSANDASIVIAQGLSGSVRSFAERMNAQARALGATNTHFVNPNGLPAADHYTSARDLATMFSTAMQNPLFQQIVNTKSTTVSPASGSVRRIALHNHNRLLGNYRIHVVGKTGWTLAAKKCFVGAASADGREVVVAVLGSRDLWGDLKQLIEYGIDRGDPPVPEAAELQAVALPLLATPVAAGDADESDSSRQAQRYSVRLATFRSITTATRLKSTVAQSGYGAHIEEVRRGRQASYRVSLGPYTNRPQAERAAHAVKRTHRNLVPIIVAGN